MTSSLDQRIRAVYRDAEAQLSARTVAELHRRRIAACRTDDDRRRATGGFGWPLAGALGSACALALGFALWLPLNKVPEDISQAPMMAVVDAADALEALDSINLTALDEDSDFFLWLAAHEASLLAME